MSVPAPTDLSRSGKHIWRLTHEALVKQGTWQDHDIAALERYVRAVELARELRAAIGNQWVVEGSQGQDVANKLIRPMQEAEKQADAFAEKLMLTPLARHKNKLAAEEEVEDPLEDILG